MLNWLFYDIYKKKNQKRRKWNWFLFFTIFNLLSPLSEVFLIWQTEVFPRDRRQTCLTLEQRHNYVASCTISVVVCVKSINARNDEHLQNKNLCFFFALLFDWTRGSAVPKLLNIDMRATMGSNPETHKSFPVHRREAAHIAMIPRLC